MSGGFNEELGKRLKRARDELGLTLEEVAEKLDMKNYQTISSMENGSRHVKAHELAELAKIYFKDVDYFLKLDNKVEETSLVFWRHSIAAKKVRTAKEQEFIKYCQNYFELEEKFNIGHKAVLPTFNLTSNDFTFAKSEEIAMSSIAKCN